MSTIQNPKYELIASDRPEMYRIKALRNFADVTAGDIGGYVASGENLSHAGNCWLYDNSSMYGDSSMHRTSSMHGDSSMHDSSSMYGYSRISSNTHLHWKITETPVTVNASDGYTMAYDKENNKISAGCRYFTVPEAIEHWTKTRGNTALGRERLAAVTFLTSL